MNTILISYDLRAPGKDYSKLWEHLKSYPCWARPLESFWLIKTDYTPSQVFDAVAKHVDQNDKIFVIDVTSRAATWINIPDDVSEWIKSNL